MSAPPTYTVPPPMPRIHAAPVISPNSNSPEAKMARDTKTIELQLAADTKYDTAPKYEPFIGSFSGTDKSMSLLAIATIFGAIVLFKTKIRRIL
jgi:hypothetical protein